jgi:crotonobetaine/carnitine-CoA ligase
VQDRHKGRDNVVWVDLEEKRLSIGGALSLQAERNGDAPFLLADDRRLTYADVDGLTDARAAGLDGLGVEPGDVVALFMENSLEFVLCSFAINKRGAAWSPINAVYRGDWLRRAIEDIDSDILIVDAALLPRVLELGDGLPTKKLVIYGDLRGDPPPMTWLTCEELAGHTTRRSTLEVLPAALGAVIWTSGTTGRSKGVMESNYAWLSGGATIARARDTQPADIAYCCLPLYNTGGWSINLFGALSSGTAVAIDQHFSVTEFWNRCRHFNATQMATVGIMQIYLWQQPEKPNDRDNAVRVAGLMTGMPPDLVEPFKERFGIDLIWNTFGQSEVMSPTITQPGKTYPPGSTGHPRPDMEVKVLNEDDYEVAVGETGEICVRPLEPDIIFSGYYRQPEATLESFRNLWYHSGDLGKFDEDGQLYFVDRKSDSTRYKGRNISSFEIESVARNYPNIRECAAIGITSAELEVEDEVMLCVVATDAEIDPHGLARFINDNAPYYFVPRYIVLIDEIPHTPTGKVQKHLLRQAGVPDGAWDRNAEAFELKR